MEQQFGKCLATFLHLLNQYEERANLPYHIFMINLFISLPLLEELHKRGYNETSTIRVNQLRNYPLVKSKTMKK